MNKVGWVVVICMILVTQILLISSIISSVHGLNDLKNTYQTSFSERQEVLLDEPIRGRMVDSNSYAIRDTTFYILMQDDYYAKGGVRTIFGFFVLKIQYTNDFTGIISTDKIQLNLPNTTVLNGFSFDGNNFYTFQSIKTESLRYVITNVLAFNMAGILLSNSSLTLPNAINSPNFYSYKRMGIFVRTGLVYIPEIIVFQKNYIIDTIEDLSIYSLSNMTKLDTYSYKYGVGAVTNIDKATIWIQYYFRPDKNIGWYESKNQPVYLSYFGYNLELNEDLNQSSIIVHIRGSLERYSSQCGDQDYWCTEFFSSSSISENSVFLPVGYDLKNKQNNSRFYMYAGFNRYHLVKEYPGLHLVLRGFYLLTTVVMVKILFDDYKKKKVTKRFHQGLALWDEE